MNIEIKEQIMLKKQIFKYEEVQKKGQDFAFFVLDYCPAGRELNLALTKIEEAVMWANAAIAVAKLEDSLNNR